MECLHCKGEMIRGTAPFSIDRDGYHISWDDVPAWTCSQCGEPYFEAAEIDHIQRALEQVDAETDSIDRRRA